MYSYLSKTKQSLALKLMAIYTLKSNILVYFSHINYLLVLSRFKSLYFLRLVAASSHWAALARCTTASHVQAQCVMMNSCPHGKRSSTCSTSLRRRVTVSSPICWSATAERTAPEAEYICPAGFLRSWPVGVELVAGLPERPGSQQRHFLQASKDVFVCSVLIYVQCIRAFTTMRDINLRFTYLLTYFHFCETALKYRFIHQSSLFKFAIHFLSVSHLNSLSARHQNCYLTCD